MYKYSLLSSALSLNLIPIFTAESRLELFLIYQFNNGLYYYGYSKNESTKISANGIQW
jgi:hypothetical protein